MNLPRLKLLHVSPWVRTKGGVETLLARHAKTDPANGFDAWQLALFDRAPAPPGEPYSTQSFSWRSTPRVMRRAMAQTFARHAGSITVWHNAWGLPWFGDVDGSTRRIVCLEDSDSQFGALLPGLAGMVDGVTCLSNSAARAVVRLLPGLPPERLTVLPLPIAPPAGLESTRQPRPELVIGCAGRLVRAQKRWDRLVPLVHELRRLGVKFRLEVASDGPLRKWLEQRLGRDPSVRFLGWQDAAAYWRSLQTWDAAVFMSDHEGGPIVLLEVMAAGVVPFYPRIGGSLGDDYAAGIDPRCHYPAGDPGAAARALQAVFASAPAVLAELRQRARKLAEPHGAGAYDPVFAEFARRIAALPRLSQEPRHERRTRLADWLPLGLITRALPGALSS